MTAAACSALVGCGGSARPVILNTERVERAVERSIHQQRGLNGSVSCPANVEQRKGNTFNCVATVGRSHFAVTVEQVDGQGHVRYVVR